MTQPVRRGTAAESKVETTQKPEVSPAPHSWAWIAKISGAVFGTIVAPVVVAVIIKGIDGPPPTATAISDAPQKSNAAVSTATEIPATSAATGKPGGTNQDPSQNTKPPEPAATSRTTEQSAAAVKAEGSSTGQPPARKGTKKNMPGSAEIAATENPAPEQVSGWVTLFNGHDFTGWVVPRPKHWSVDAKNKTIVADFSKDADKRPSFLLTADEYDDFRLRWEYRMESNSDSGVALRTLERENFLDRMQIQLWGGDEKSAKVPTGTIMGLPTDADDGNTRPKIPAPLRSAQSWNVAEIEFLGPRLKVTINGKVIQEVRIGKKVQLANARPDLLRTSGRIGLQCQAGRVEFRRIEIKKLVGVR